MKKKKPVKSRLALPGRDQSGGVRIEKIPSGIPGLDDILGGGIPEFSFNIVAGAPGTGKTTLVHQIAAANGTVAKPTLYFSILGEPVLKMLRYQQQYTFFDKEKIGREIKFVSLSDLVMKRDLKLLLQEIVRHVTEVKPGIVIVDSFRSLVRATNTDDENEMQAFINHLAQFLTGWETTTLLVGEYTELEVRDNPLFTMVDGIIWLSQLTERNSVVRKLQVVKLRGQGSVPGLHTVRISDSGVRAFSRSLGLSTSGPAHPRRRKLACGIPELDRMMGGGIREGDSVLIAGPSGAGKSAFATHYIAEGLRNGEPGIIAIFEERPEGYKQRAGSFGLDLRKAQASGLLEILYLRPLDLSVDETMQAILDAIKRVKARRLVIDSLVGFEMALAPSFRADFRESLYRMIAALTGAGVTVLSTVEVEDNFTSFQLSHYAISFLTDDIIRCRFVEIDGQLRKIITVVKMRGSNHSKDIREYVIGAKGIELIAPRRTDYHALLSGIPVQTGHRKEQAQESPPEAKSR